MPVQRLDQDKSILNNLIKRMHNRDKDPLGPLIDRYYMERGRSTSRLVSVTLPLAERPRPGGRLSPSSMGGCMRAAAFKFVNMPGVVRTNPDMEAIFEDGNWRHHKWGAIFRDMEMVLGPDVIKVIKIEGDCSIPDLYTAGSYDIVVKINGVKWVIDFKGINDAGFTRVINTDAPLPKHVDQIMTYEEARKVPRGIVLYENKNDNRHRGFIVRWEEQKWGEVTKWAERVLWYLRRRKLPPKDVECETGTYMYDKCPYAKWCFGNRSAEEVQEVTFKRFRGVDHAWEAGHAITGTQA